MSPSFVFNSVLGNLFLPPLNGLLLVVLGLLLLRRAPRLGPTLIAFGLLMLTLLSMKAVSDPLARLLESQTPPLHDVKRDARDDARAVGAKAIVILGGGRSPAQPNYGGDEVSSDTLARLRYGAKLARETGLPILVTGGAPDGRLEPEASLMARALRDFGQTARWEEGASDNTAENAKRSAVLLKAAGATRVLLVTDAMHMPRAQRIFIKAGIEVVPAPSTFHAPPIPLSPLDFIPGATSLKTSRYALHELLGQLWYSLRY